MICPIQVLLLNRSIDWLKNYKPIKNYIKEIKTACLWKKKSSSFSPDFCPVKLNNDPWIVQPTEHFEELNIKQIIEKHKKKKARPLKSSLLI